MKYADLHIHSSFSDGCLSPEEIVKEAKEKDLKYISITDHDTISSQYITKMNIDGINIIPGIEFSSEYNESEIHILGYYIDIENDNLKAVVKLLKQLRIERTEQIIKKLAENSITINMDDLMNSKNQVVGRGSIAAELLNKGYVKTCKEAFNKYLMKGKLAYVEGFKMDYKNILDVIRDSNGIAVLAHPGNIYKNIQIESMIKDLRGYGLQGIEVYHPSHTKDQINYFYNLSKKYKLIITGGSDFHTMNSNNSCLGSEGLNKLLMEKLINYKLKQ